ncbi:MAG TPA: NAD(P)/FAD-dependent oxidoreductase [Candidatus Methanoperedens sp.]
MSDSENVCFTRREFIVGAAKVAATGVMLPEILMPKVLISNEPRIAIIGGGIAGLTAALTLADAGVTSTLYEASEIMIGGRMLTERPSEPSCGICHSVKGKSDASRDARWDDGQYTDICGELIDSTHTTMISLAKRFNLPLIDLIAAQPKGSTDTYYFSEKHYSKAQADADFAKLYPVLMSDLDAAGYPTTYNMSTPEGRALDTMSVYDWIESRVEGGHKSRLGRLLDAAYTIEYGADTSDQSALNLIYLLGYSEPNQLMIFGESDERYRIAGGADRLPKAIAEYLRICSTVKLGWRLESIALEQDGRYVLTFNNQRVVTADYVILAIPFAVLRHVDYSKAGFDELKIKAIQELGAGHNGKLQLQFTARYWNQKGDWGISNGSSYADTGYECTWESTRGQGGRSGILVNYTGGSVADSMRLKHPYGNSRDPRVIADAETFLAQIEPVFPGVGLKWNGKASSSMPHLNPLWNSSYSYWRVGQYQTIAGYERVRQGNIFFAGEHTSLNFQGFMEGAASEGVSAAEEILDILKKKDAHLFSILCRLWSKPFFEEFNLTPPLQHN